MITAFVTLFYGLHKMGVSLAAKEHGLTPQTIKVTRRNDQPQRNSRKKEKNLLIIPHNIL